MAGPSAAATGLACFDTAVARRAGLVRKILEEEGIHRALEADMQVGDLALRQVTIFASPKAMRLNMPATSSWSRLMRLSASAPAVAAADKSTTSRVTSLEVLDDR